MEKILVILIGCFLFFGSVFVNADFGDINIGNENISADNSSMKVQDEVFIDNSKITGSRDKGIAEIVRTRYFYFALGLGAVVLLLIFYFLYHLVTGPRVKWKKPKPVKI